MTHEDFVAAYRAGRLEVKIDHDAASRLVSGRAMLPLVLLPVLGYVAVQVAWRVYVVAAWRARARRRKASA